MPITLDVDDKFVSDISNSPNRGTIYVNWADQRNGKANTDIWLKKSTDGGSTWSSDVKVNADNSERHQFLSWMTVDQSTGYLYVVYYDRREHEDKKTDVYLSVSKDGGVSFKDYKISEYYKIIARLLPWKCKWRYDNSKPEGMKLSLIHI